MLIHACPKRSCRVLLALAGALSALAACGKAEPGQNDSSAATEPTPPPVDAVAEEAREKTVWERLGELEIPGMTRERTQVQSEYATLAFATATANAKGNTAQIEITVGACVGCKATTKAEVEGRKEQLLAQLGELHAKSPGLVWTVEELELMPQRSAVATYARSFVDDGQTRAAVHTLELSYVANDVNVRLFAYPRSGFPASDKELAEGFSREELIAAATTVFKAVVAVVWP